MSAPPSPVGAPDALTPRDLKACAALVEKVLESKAPDSPERRPWEGTLARLRGEEAARPPSAGSTIASALVDVVTQAPEAAERAVTKIADAVYRTGDVEGAALIRRAAMSVRKARGQGRGGGLGGGGGGGDDARMSDDRAIEWFEPSDLVDPVIHDARMEPVFRRLVRELQNAEVFLEYGIEAPTRAIFSGPPGTGKTLCGRWIGAELKVPVALVQIAGVMIPYVGATEKNLRRVFDEFSARHGAILFLDEIDGLSTRRDDDGGGGAYSKGQQTVTTVMLQLLDKLPKNRIVIAATNFPDKIDPALDRRLPTKIEFFYPDAAARRAMLAAWWKKLKVDDAARTMLVTGTDGRSGDFVRNVAMNAARLALTDEAMTPRRVMIDHVAQALAEGIPPGELKGKGGGEGGGGKDLD